MRSAGDTPGRRGSPGGDWHSWAGHQGAGADGQRRWGRFGDDGPPELPGARIARVWIPVVIAFLVQVPYAIVRVVRPERFDLTESAAVLGLLIAIVGPLALIGARRCPGTVVALVCAAASADLLVTARENGPPYVALAFAVIGAVVRGARVTAWVSIAVAWVVTVVVGTLTQIDWRPIAVAGITFGILVVLGIGESIRGRRERFLRARREVVERKQTEVQAERVRIARELHDVLAHSLSQINVQAGVGLHLMERQPEKAAEALASIKESSKRALDEVRSVLGVLRADSADPSAPLVPEPDLARLPELVASVGAQGIRVTLESSVATAPSAALGLAAYRIVQESLTNVVRHAEAHGVTVIVSVIRDSDEHALRVEVVDDGRGLPDGPPVTGRGVLGMRERAELLGGTFEISRADPGGTRVVAHLPIPRTERHG